MCSVGGGVRCLLCVSHQILAPPEFPVVSTRVNGRLIEGAIERERVDLMNPQFLISGVVTKFWHSRKSQLYLREGAIERERVDLPNPRFFISGVVTEFWCPRESQLL